MIYKKDNQQKGIFDEAEKMESLNNYRDPFVSFPFFRTS